MKKIKVLLSAFVVLTLLASCRNTVQEPAKEKAPAAAPAVKLTCVSKGEDENGVPKNEVILSVDGKEKLVASTTGCQEITKQEYSTYEIPDQAVAACGGWWAGAGNYYYAVVKEGVVTVFEGWNEEGQADKGYHWKEKIN